MFKYVEKLFATWLLGIVKADATELEAFLAPYVSQGETAVVAAITKFNPYLGQVVAAAVAALGPDVPKFEGDAVAWVEKLLKAWIATL